jgi:hypothetical protein
VTANVVLENVRRAFDIVGVEWGRADHANSPGRAPGKPPQGAAASKRLMAVFMSRPITSDYGGSFAEQTSDWSARFATRCARILDSTALRDEEERMSSLE